MWAYPRASGAGRALPHSYPHGAGILTCFPFGRSELRPALGPTNPRLTTVAEEPWPLRRRGFSPLYAATTAGIFDGDGSTGPHGPASAPSPRPPTGSRAERPVPRGLGGRLSPVHLRGPPARPVSCYALLSRWLLLSLRPGCLSRGTPFEIDT